MKTQTLDKNLNDLGHFYGTEGWHKLSFQILCSDGMAYVAENAGAYWLLDVVSSYLPAVKRSGDRMSVCRLKKRTNGEWVFTMEHEGEVIVQEIEYSDFPLEDFTMYLCDNGFGWCLMLPSEY